MFSNVSAFKSYCFIIGCYREPVNRLNYEITMCTGDHSGIIPYKQKESTCLQFGEQKTFAADNPVPET